MAAVHDPSRRSMPISPAPVNQRPWWVSRVRPTSVNVLQFCTLKRAADLEQGGGGTMEYDLVVSR